MDKKRGQKVSGNRHTRRSRVRCMPPQHSLIRPSVPMDIECPSGHPLSTAFPSSHVCGCDYEGKREFFEGIRPGVDW